MGERREIGATSPLEGELKKRELVLTVTGQRTHLTPSTYILKPCFAAGLFLSRVCALPGRESRMPAEVAAIRPAVAGTRGMNPSWGGKDRRASARSSGRSICVNWHAALSSHSPSPDRVPVPRPARGAPFTTHRHTIAASTATRSATPPFMGTADGADKTFSSHPAEIADRARRVRLPAIEALAGN